MQIAVASRNLEVTPSLRSTVEEKITRLGRFLEGMERAEVRFSEERNPRIAEREVCEVTMHGHGHVVRAKAGASDPFAAVDLVVDKLEHRMEKLKGKLLGRSHRRRAKPASVDSVPGAASSALVDEDDDEPGDDQPRIVRTKQFAMKPMTAEEAVLHLELLGHGFFLFTNADTGRASVVYRRNHDDGFGLIEAT